MSRSASASPTLILGAGIAGLVAADELARAGQDVLLLEARSEPGGRVRTLRREFEHGMHAEAGAARIPESHALTLALTRRLGLETEPFRPAPPVLFVGGHRFAHDDEAGVARAFGFTPAEVALGPRGIRAQLQALAVSTVVDATAADWPPRALARVDDLSGEALIRELGFSDAVARWLDMGGGGISVHASALNILREMTLTQMRSPVRVVGGNDRLAQTLAAGLDGRIRYDTIVRRIEQRPDGVRVIVERRGVRSEVTGARAIVTLPFTTLREVEIDPPCSDAKMRAIRELHYDAVSRVFAQTRTRPWARGGRAAFAVTDQGFDVFDAGFARPGPQGLLLAYYRDAAALRLDALPPDERESAGVGHLDAIWPGVARSVERTAYFSWDAEPWARGAAADFSPGQMVAYLPLIARAEGRLHFAGEHTSPWAGWIQGAVDSGLRAASEVRAASDAPLARNVMET